ncbi:glycosaminoglycan attachment site [Pseudoalteromonas sp. DL2-H2.2]|uniref:glycosaminoglycan attachment site n=1 Tax=Pseudoalteromonas sp. DL2-H2.2 TaxID=2908889 RepID=UPI001F45C786|nr:glycosaminoglycan attachment site [Pseudoalteromonas sp. DL2-H2.2]MCF2908296.1 glycosaminoglycan attachment site [Pseudoalteromonas sp. DL2-H2.2]
MELFQPLVKEEDLHKNYTSIMRQSKEGDRQELLRWCEGFPDRDNKFVKEFQTTFNSSFWEIYLYALFREIGHSMEWSYSTPDFLVEHNSKKIVIEATIAAAASGKTPEWEKDLMESPPTKFKEMNMESIIRLSNSIISKYRKYKEKYSKLEHVKGNPFVIAVAPFEQPHFNLQCEVPIMALLYDFYVDEDAYNDNPHLYPNGPPGVNLGFVEKDNGAEIQLGLFEDDQLSDISAIVLSTTATWGKVESMSGNSDIMRFVNTVWWSEEEGSPITKQAAKENIRDGLFVFHNPYAKRPLDPEMYNHSGITQVFVDPETKIIDKKRNGLFLMHRQSLNFGIK